MKRREFITLLGGAAAAWPLAARAQQPRSGQRVPHVGILNYAAAQDLLVDEFRSALRELGRVEGQNLAITYRWADGQLERLPLLATELVASNVDVLIALGPASWAAKRATSTIPIVMAFSGDPVANGVVTNLARPGGNITGFSYMSPISPPSASKCCTEHFRKTLASAFSTIRVSQRRSWKCAKRRPPPAQSA
jgi:putative ABC transport system substrate-binding protein